MLQDARYDHKAMMTKYLLRRELCVHPSVTVACRRCTQPSKRCGILDDNLFPIFFAADGAERGSGVVSLFLCLPLRKELGGIEAARLKAGRACQGETLSQLSKLSLQGSSHISTPSRDSLLIIHHLVRGGSHQVNLIPTSLFAASTSTERTPISHFLQPPPLDLPVPAPAGRPPAYHYHATIILPILSCPRWGPTHMSLDRYSRIIMGTEERWTGWPGDLSYTKRYRPCVVRTQYTIHGATYGIRVVAGTLPHT